MGVRHVLVGGLATDGCVLLTALDATDRGYETHLIADGTVTFTSAIHESALQSFARLWGGVVTTAETLSIDTGE